MYAITGITGKVGGEVARVLLGAGRAVRAVVRDARKAADWRSAGVEAAVAAMTDAGALSRAFGGAEAVFVLPPPVFDPAPGFPEARASAAALRAALAAARPSRVVCVSTIGAQAQEQNLLTQLSIMEQELGRLDLPVTFLRPAWYMENAAWDVDPARGNGVIDTFLQPLDRPVPMVATADVGRLAAELLRESWTGTRTVELEGPERVTPAGVAALLGEALGRPVRAAVVPRDRWEGIFRAQGMRNPTPRIRMLDGFNEGWIAFESAAAPVRRGSTTLREVVARLVAGAAT
jgi:uncharacterized protein YbjT (DUF2867 family)